jgi:hypothetical protein
MSKTTTPGFNNHRYSPSTPEFYKRGSSKNYAPKTRRSPIDIVPFPSTGQRTSISAKVPLDRNGIKLHKFLKEMQLTGNRMFFKLKNGFISIEGSRWQAGDKLTRASLLTAGDTVKVVVTEASEPVIIKREDMEKKPRLPQVRYVV